MANENIMDTVNVLVVDDEKSIREGSERILKRMGCHVFQASRGDEGLVVLNKEQIAIVLLDMKMPGMDGMEVLRRIRALDESIMVIVITGFATVETAIEAMKRGAYDFIPKPFEPDQLRIVIDRACEKIRLTRETAKLERERTRTLADLGTEKSRIRTIIDSLPNGLLVTNSDGQVVLANPAFYDLLDLDADQIKGNQLNNYIADEELCDLISEISQGKFVDYEDIPPIEFAVSEESYIMARGKPVLGHKGECLGAVISLVNVTALKVLDRLKTEFLAEVSHELRSPLSTIHEQLAVVLQDMVNEESRDQHLLSRAKEKTQGLISLIGDLLDLSRIDTGAVCQEPKAVSLENLLESIVDFMETRATGKNQKLKLELPANPLPPFSVDPLAIESIFGNLITNALNYTPDGGEITVKVETEGNKVKVRVIDNGLGIEAKHMDKIFERFYRVKNESTRYITGTGLGLPIVKGLVDSLDGDISVESQPGVGTTFTVVLPLPQ